MPASTGVFTLEELLALGQTGDPRTDWLAQKQQGDDLIEGGEHIMLPANLPAGYYKVDDSGSALFVDVHSGTVPRAFVDFFNAGKLKRDPFTNLPLNWIDPDAKGEYSSKFTPEMEEQLRLEATGLSRQQAQDIRLARQQAAIPWPNTPPAQGYTPGSSTGAYTKFVAQGGTDEMLGLAGWAPGSEQQVAARDAMAAIYLRNMQAQQGLRENRESRGLDPETGVSEAEKKRIYDTYRGITDPATRSMFISAQDPGNLIPELREARTAARAGEKALIAGQNQPIVEYGRMHEGARMAEFVVKRGDVTQVDPETGRERVYGGVPLAVEAIKPKYRLGEDIMKRVGGGVMGAGLSLATGGGVVGALIGGYAGAGGWMPQVGGPAGLVLGSAVGYATGSWAGALAGGLAGAGGVRGLKKGTWGQFRGFGDWKPGGPSVPGGMGLGSAVVFGEIMARGASASNTRRQPMVIEGQAWA